MADKLYATRTGHLGDFHHRSFDHFVLTKRKDQAIRIAMLAAVPASAAVAPSLTM